MLEVICFGEAVVDMIALEHGVSMDKATAYIAVAGGAVANVAVGLRKLNVTSGFMGKLGRDPFGTLLARTLTQYGVDVRGLSFTADVRTTLAFVSDREEGFFFYRNPGADMMMRPEDIDESLIKEATIFHFGSLSMTNEPSQSATTLGLEYARKHHLLISFDPNYRPQLWPNEERAKRTIREAISQVDIVKLSLEELEFLTGTSNIEKGSGTILDLSASTVIVTAGERGSFISTGKLSRFVKAPKISAVETTGCGDAFTAAMLSKIIGWERERKDIVDLSVTEVDRTLLFANAAGALTATRKGVMPSLPTYAELVDFLKKQGR